MSRQRDDAELEAIDHAAFRQLVYALAPDEAEAYDHTIDAVHDVIERQQTLQRRVDALEQRLDERDAVDRGVLNR